MSDFKPPKSFEDALKRLEDIVAKLENGEQPLEKSLELFEEGVKLSRYCNDKLNEAEKKIQQLTKNASGELVTQEMELPELNQSKGKGEEVPF